VRRVQHTGYDVIGQRLAHRRRQRLTTSGSGFAGSGGVIGDEESDEFSEGRGSNDATLEDRSQQLNVVSTGSTESTVQTSLITNVSVLFGLISHLIIV